MAFYSLTFAIFFAATVALYFIAPPRLQVPVLLAASVVFYVSFVPRYIFVLLALIAVDYSGAFLLQSAERDSVRKAWLILSLALNLAFMASFKYAADIFGASFGIIPIGLSFHTF